MSSDLEAHNGEHSDSSKHTKVERTTEHYGIVDESTGEVQEVGISTNYLGKLGAFSLWLENFGVEARGYQRVLPEERSSQSYWGLTLIWTSAGLTISNFTSGLYGPQYFGLTFGQTAAIIWGVGALGAACSAWLAIFGKRNGLRALVNSRYAFGFYGSMVMAFLNIVTEIIFGILACILGGQTLNAMSSDKLPTWVGVILIGISSWIIGTAGFKYIHHYARVAWILPMIVYICLYAKGASQFTNMANPTALEPETAAGLALSYAAIVFAGGSGWVCVSADYYIYFPVNTPDWKIFGMSFLGIWLVPAFATTCGAGYGAALFQNEEWATAFYDGGETSAALIEYVLRPLGDVRYFFLFVLAFSMMSNNVFNLYSISISMQLFGTWPSKLPRYVYSFIAAVIMIIISCVGYNSLYAIFSNLVAIIAYWSIIYFGILVEEHLFFRRSSRAKPGVEPYDLTAWDNPSLLPKGYAAMLAFCIGAAGAVVGMSETWYVGPIGKMIGEDGGDLGTELGFGFAAIVYPVLRWWEIRVFGL